MKKILIAINLLMANCMLLPTISSAQAITSHGHTSNFAGASAFSVTVAKPSTVQQNDFLLAHISGRVITGFALTAPSGWTLIRKLNSGSQFGTHVFYKIASASEPVNYTFTDSTGSMLYDKLGAVSVWRGVNITSPINVKGDTISNGSPHTLRSVTTNVDSCMILTLFADGSGSTWIPPAGMTEEYDTSASQSSYVSVTLGQVLQASMGSTGAKTSVSQYNSLATGFIIALQPVSFSTGISTFYADASIRIFPNPVAGELNFQIFSKEQENISIEIYDVCGKLITSKSSSVSEGNNLFAIDMESASKGIYMLNVKTKSISVRKKFVKQ